MERSQGVGQRSTLNENNSLIQTQYCSIYLGITHLTSKILQVPENNLYTVTGLKQSGLELQVLSLTTFKRQQTVVEVRKSNKESNFCLRNVQNTEPPECLVCPPFLADITLLYPFLLYCWSGSAQMCDSWLGSNVQVHNSDSPVISILFPTAAKNIST